MHVTWHAFFLGLLWLMPLVQTVNPADTFSSVSKALPENDKTDSSKLSVSTTGQELLTNLDQPNTETRKTSLQTELPLSVQTTHHLSTYLSLPTSDTSKPQSEETLTKPPTEGQESALSQEDSVSTSLMSLEEGSPQTQTEPRANTADEIRSLVTEHTGTALGNDLTLEPLIFGGESESSATNTEEPLTVVDSEKPSTLEDPQVTETDDSTESSTSTDPTRNTRKPATPYPQEVIEPGNASDLQRTKGRFNHASVDCAAVVIKTNPEAKGASAILTNSKEKYMLNLCSATKFVIIELCDDILMDTLTIANYEFFSSTFKEFTVHVTDRYPPKNNVWKFLGRFHAKNTREAQVFPVPNPVMWARYIRIDFVSHYSNEYYCPVSFIRVYGNTMMEQYKKEEEDLQADLHEVPSPVLVRNPVATKPKPWIDPPPATRTAVLLPDGTRQTNEPSVTLKDYWDRLDQLVLDDSPIHHVLDEQPELYLPLPGPPRMPFIDTKEPLNDADATGNAAQDSPGMGGQRDVAGDGTDSQTPDHPAVEKAGSDHVIYDGSEDHQVLSDGEGHSDDSQIVKPQPIPGDTPDSPVQAPRAESQETIFKTIMRRLGWLDRNLTLTYQYLDEQSLAINDVLNKLDYTHRFKLQQAFSYLNTTTTKQIQALKITCEEIWKAIIFDVEDYEHKNRKQLEELESRLDYLSQEVVFEKRMRIAQLILLLAVILVIGLSKALRIVSPNFPEDKKDK
ncbi:hypothetical protein IWQ62_002024 [Dispira parvispora]|uniref:SUN-like protein 1 n=1 Tax=Dispira parvispora TaxID=1520584 RepID=A0A9W8AR64_9FUNG|nr:hypothetical protein IWQ62_002024 [Dispira parvispora]